ncbi:MAG TPA: LamG domain-containing protein [Sedimentisphaerales bacterium]|nr:LamG domain-containing protein [Sedimentisphaerales bacterium]
MCRKLICLFAFVLVLGTAGNVSADLVAYWKLDETSGTTAFDSSGNVYDGTLAGSPAWADGKIDGALEFHAGGDCVEYIFPDETWEACSIAFWVKVPTLGQAGYKSMFSNYTPNNAGLQIDVDGGNPGNYRVHPGGLFFGTVQTDWVHLTLTSEGTSASLYYNGNYVTSGTLTDMLFNKFALGVSRSKGSYAECTIDDFRVYDHVLSEAEIQGAMAGYVKSRPNAYSPEPEDGSILEDTWVNISWKPGGSAASHDVYFSDNFDDVNAGAESAFQGNQGETSLLIGFVGFPIPDGFVPGTTYYWRVDEVNDLDPNSPWKGDIWSFTVPTKTAYDQFPPDGSKYVDPNVQLSWTGGFGARVHYPYLGESFEDVNSATGGSPQTQTTYDTGILELDKVYYWRVDEFDGNTTHKGDVMSFSTLPPIPITDETLVAWWTLDEGMGTTALDWSGHGNHGTLFGPAWTSSGVHGDAGLDFSNGGYVAIQNLSYENDDNAAVTVCAWVRTDSEDTQYIVSFDRNEYYRLEINGDGAGPGQVGWDLMTNSGQLDHSSVRRVDDGAWHHVCGVFDNGQATIYIDGSPEPSVNSGSTFGSGDLRFGYICANSEASSFDGGRGGGSPVSGSVDDVRIYNTALTQEQIILVMRGDPLLVWQPSPADGLTPDIENATPLSFSPGDMASGHDVYFGTDKDAVANADASDATGVYRGRQNGTNFTPAEGVEWGGGPYYWRIDENNTDGTVTRGRVWSFTVADFILIEDFENYNAGENQIWYSWHDGLGYGVPGTPPYFAGNGTGAAVGDETTGSYTEETIVNTGGQSMPLLYDNNKQGYAMYSETELALSGSRDWTKHGLGELSLWFRGFPVSTGSFAEGPAGTYTITASGTDIWGTADQFHFAYKMLTGPGSIVAKVESVQNTHAWAKAGVMIRETLDAGSKQAIACVSPGSGVAFQGRIAADGDSFSTSQAGITAPCWVKLERDFSGNFSVQHSANGSAWQPVENAIPMNIPMNTSVYVGLALSSHDASLTCEAVFSNVTITGTAGPQWMSQDIGIIGNNLEPLYVAVSNKTGAPAVVYNDNPDAAVTNIWTEWIIPLQAFADQGVNLADIDRIAIGLGTKGNMTTAGGSGKMFFDDIRLYRPRDAAEE